MLPKRYLCHPAPSPLPLSSGSEPPKAGQVDYFDKGYPGLVLRVSYGGARTWVYLHRLHGKLRRHTLGRWPAMTLAEAREAWRDASKLVSRGEGPGAPAAAR